MHAQAYDFRTLPLVSDDRNIGYAINDRGDVVGTNGPGQRSFSATLWRDGVPARLGALPSAPYGGSLAHAINNTGMSVGQDGVSNAILWHGLQATRLPSLPGGRAAAFGLNDRGQAVGWSTRQDAGGFPTLGIATLWDQGRAIDLDTLGGDTSQALAINERGDIAGWSRLSDGFSTHATLWRDGQAVDLGAAGGVESQANAINDHGVIAGSFMAAEVGHHRAAVWHDAAAAPTVLGMIGNDWVDSLSRGINNHGQVVGLSTHASGALTSATLWNGTEALDLNTFLSAAEQSAGWQLLEANGINDSGWITGTAYNRQSSQYAAYVLAIPPIPEPASLALLGAGLAVLAAARRRRTA